MSRDYVLFECSCHPPVSIVAPERDGERHAICYPRYYPPGARVPDEIVDEEHRLVARAGKWEIAQ